MSYRLKDFRSVVLATTKRRTLYDFIAAFLPYRPIRTSQALWERRYTEGAWDQLHDIGELGRYSVISGYIHFLTRKGDILDVGCGEGLLLQKLCQSTYAKYLGIDLSAVAIDKANQRREAHDPRRAFLTADMETFTTDAKFDLIVFNECLYYLPAPVRTLRRYEGFLATNGAIIVSMHETVETKKIWTQIDDCYAVQDSVAITNKNGNRWIIKLLGGLG